MSLDGNQIRSFICILTQIVKQEREEGAAAIFDIFTGVIRYVGKELHWVYWVQD